MRLKGLVAFTVATSVMATPALAAVNPAASLSIAPSVRATSHQTNASGFAFTTGFFEILIAIGIITAAVIVVSDNKAKSP